MQINRISAVSGNVNKTNNTQTTTFKLTNPLKKDEVSFGHSTWDFIDSVIEEAGEMASKEGRTVKQVLRNVINDDFSSTDAQRAARKALDRLEDMNPFDYD